MKFKRGQKGFTLMELMVVMAILAILSGIVAGGVVGVGTQGKEVTVTSDQKVIQSAVDRFYSDADPQLYPILDGDVSDETDATGIANVMGDRADAVPTDAGSYVIDFGYPLPAVGDANGKVFVPDYVKEVPTSADRVTWVLELPAAVVDYIGDPSGAAPVPHPDDAQP